MMFRPYRLASLCMVVTGMVFYAREGDAKPAGRAVIVASKPFGESFLLAEMFAQLLESRGISVARKPGLGATEVAFAALRADRIDVYPEYTGTGLIAILHREPESSPQATFARVSQEFSRLYSVRWLPPLGFENTYAIAVRRETAQRYRLATLTDLARVAPELRAGFTADFIERKDGLPGLRSAYGLSFARVSPLGQALKYQALASGAVDVVDGYSTDGFIARYAFVVLEDDKRFFPSYEAAAIVGPRLQRDNPAAIAVLTELSGRLDVAMMRQLNLRVEVGREPVSVVARDALGSIGLTRAGKSIGSGSTVRSSQFLDFARSSWRSLVANTLRHVELVCIALLAGILTGVPLGLWLERSGRAAEPVVRAVGLLQTIPSIALLALMVPLLGIGVWPALVALWLYSLYPIVRNTYSGVRDADPQAVNAAIALGMTPGQVLRDVRFPLAAPALMSGIRTAAVIGVGTATLAAFIGAGGLGEPIATGLALADTRLILSGAIPAALLALLVDLLLGWVERATTPAPLRHREKTEPRESQVRGAREA